MKGICWTTKMFNKLKSNVNDINATLANWASLLVQK